MSIQSQRKEINFYTLRIYISVRGFNKMLKITFLESVLKKSNFQIIKFDILISNIQNVGVLTNYWVKYILFVNSCF